MLSYQRCKLLQNGFLFLINAAKLIKMLQNYSILVFMFCRITFLVSSQRRKCIRISFFWFPIYAAKCCRIFFFGFSSTPKSVENFFFMVSYQRRKLLQSCFFDFSSTRQIGAELLLFDFLPTPQSASELLFLVLINAAKCCRFTSF